MILFPILFIVLPIVRYEVIQCKSGMIRNIIAFSVFLGMMLHRPHHIAHHALISL